MKSLRCYETYRDYEAAWQDVACAGYRQLNLDAWASGRRYLSLATLELSARELSQLRAVAVRFGRLLDVAVARILEDPDWWPALAWPWPAIELARQEPARPTSLFGRFDCLLDSNGNWQVIEYNADTPSGGREACGFEPTLARRHGLRAPSRGLARKLARAIAERLADHTRPVRPVRLVGVVSAHGWLEDMSEATWLAWLLRRAGQPTLVGDVTDLAAYRGGITLRGQPVDALYRFYPVERFYRHALFSQLMDAVVDRRLLLLNGLRGFVAQSKACLAWLWSHRHDFDAADCAAIERHLPETVLARDPRALDLLPRAVVKHVNGREGDSVVFGTQLESAAWDARLLEGGYVVQRAVASPAVLDVQVDDWHERLTWVSTRYACVGAFLIGGRFGGCYTRLDGPITSARATYVATLAAPPDATRARSA